MTGQKPLVQAEKSQINSDSVPISVPTTVSASENTPLSKNGVDKNDRSATNITSNNDKMMDSKIENTSVEPLYVATGTGFLLGFWKPGRVLSTDVPQILRSRVSLSMEDYGSLMMLMLVTLGVRLWNISNPPFVVHEEAILGNRINKYKTGQFFYDSQPPLISMIYYYVSSKFDYPGQFDFSKYSTYIGHAFPFFELRTFSALLGVAVVLMSFLTLKLSGMDRRGCQVGAIFVAFESSFVLEHRYIFQMPIVLFLLASITYFWKIFELQQPFSLKWHSYALMLGLLLGLLVSSQNEGWRTVIWIFIASGYQLWWSFGNPNQKYPIYRFTLNLIFRPIYFYFIPLILSAVSIGVHLNMLPGTGEGTPFVSGTFQSSFINFPNEKVVSPVGPGSMVSLRHLKTNVYLHSHEEYFLGGSQQQQVTGYGYRDLNNIWFLENISMSSGNPHAEPFHVFHDGDFVKFKHFQTRRRLHSHDKSAPVTDNDWQFEVSAYGADGYPGDINDIWQIELVQQESYPDIAKKEWRALNSIVRLKHPFTKCYLFSHRVKIPDTATAQQEITCAQNGIDENSYWFVETNYHPMHEKSEERLDVVSYRTASLMDRVDEYADLVQDTAAVLEKEKANSYSFKGYWLPLLIMGVPIYRQHFRQIVLIGNFFVWYSALGGLISYLIFKLYTIVAIQREWKRFDKSRDILEMDHQVGSFLLLWACHFTPYLFKDNTTLVDYLPALYFSILASARWLEYILNSMFRANKKLVNALYALMIACTVSTFLVYSPFVYGNETLLQTCRTLELGIWDFSCGSYFDTSEKYVEYDAKNDFRYHYMEPPSEEFEHATVITTVDKQANPTHFVMKEDDNFALDETKPEVKRFMKKFEKTVKSKKNFVELINQDDEQEVIGLDAMADKVKEEDISEEDEIEGELDPKIESKLLIQWAKITDPPALKVNSEVAASAKSELSKKPPPNQEPDL